MTSDDWPGLTCMTTTSAQDSGLAPVNGINLYWESTGTGGTPLIVLHGGYGMTSTMSHLTTAFASDRRVIAVDLQGHGRTADIDRPITYEAMGDDIAALIRHLGLGQVDLLGYSLGGGTALRTAIQHPDLVRRLVAVSAPFSSTGWYPDIQAQMKQMSRAAFPMLKQSPIYPAYLAVAPHPDEESFQVLMDKMGGLLGADYAWSDEVRAITVPTLVAFADADSLPASYAAEFFALLGGGLHDAGWDSSDRPAHRLAIVPGTSHYDVSTSPVLEPIVRSFLD